MHNDRKGLLIVSKGYLRRVMGTVRVRMER